MDEIRLMRAGIWVTGVGAWIYGLSDRTVAAILDGMVTGLEVGQLTIAALIAVMWCFLRPDA